MHKWSELVKQISGSTLTGNVATTDVRVGTIAAQTLDATQTIQKFLASKPKVEQSTLRGLRSSLFPMRDFLATRSVFYLHEISPEHLADWTNAEWGDIEPGTIRFKRIKVRSFFLYCIRNMKWLTIDQDPTSGLLESPGREGIVQVVPFDRAQYAAILAATYKQRNIETGARLRALIQLMRWSGLAIQDAVTLRRSRLTADDLLQVSRAKPEPG
jgi:integrase/recombinase XerD